MEKEEKNLNLDNKESNDIEDVNIADDVRKGPMPQPPKKKAKSNSEAKKYVDGIISETKQVTWPKRDEVLKWSVIVLAAISFFTVITFLIDNFIATPLIYGISSFSGDQGFGKIALALTVLFFTSGLGTGVGVMLHAGGDQNGLSDALSASLTGGSAIAEKNLDRITVALGIVFALTVAAMMIWFPIGSINMVAA